MRQKYIISRDGPDNKLVIKEYAVTESKVKKPASSTLLNGKFTLLCEETYDARNIENSMSKGTKSVVAALRTHNLYPIEAYAAKIAETVMALYNASEKGPVELVFDDIDISPVDMEAA